MKVHSVSKCLMSTSGLKAFRHQAKHSGLGDRRSGFSFFFCHRFFLRVGHIMSNGPSSFNVQCRYYSAPGEIQLTVYSAAHKHPKEDKADKHMINLLRGGRTGDCLFSFNTIWFSKSILFWNITFKEKTKSVCTWSHSIDRVP